jgi:hypothetical protein
MHGLAPLDQLWTVAVTPPKTVSIVIIIRMVDDDAMIGGGLMTTPRIG